jgi:hypothetical protein
MCGTGIFMKIYPYKFYYRTKELEEFCSENCIVCHELKLSIKIGCFQAWQQIYFSQTGHRLIRTKMSCFDCLYSTRNLQKQQSLEFDIKFFFPSSCLNSSFFMKHSFACARSFKFDFAFELDQDNDTPIRKYRLSTSP